MHPAITQGAVAVITGGASGIGLATARRMAAQGMQVCIADLGGPALTAASDSLAAAGHVVLAIETDVADRAQIADLARTVTARLGPVSVLMNNAGTQPGSDIFDAAGTWDRILAVNLGGVVTGVQVFAPLMIASGLPGLIINTGSKQGITTPPGDPAYNMSKAGVRVFTEALQHHLRGLPGAAVEARLLIPGYVHTPLTAHGRTEKPDAAWTPDQVADFLFAALEGDDFYILCPDNDVDRHTDTRRILWAAGDIVENRPPLSRWHPDFGQAFKDWLRQ